MNKNNLPDNQTSFLLYTGNDGKVKVEVFLKDETVWLTQKAMSELFGVKIPAISKHLSNIFESWELQKEATLSILETVQISCNTGQTSCPILTKRYSASRGGKCDYD